MKKHSKVHVSESVEVDEVQREANAAKDRNEHRVQMQWQTSHDLIQKRRHDMTVLWERL